MEMTVYVNQVHISYISYAALFAEHTHAQLFVKAPKMGKFVADREGIHMNIFSLCAPSQLGLLPCLLANGRLA